MKKMFFLIIVLTIFVMYTVTRVSKIERPEEVNDLLFNSKPAVCGEGSSREEALFQSEFSDVRKIGEVDKLCRTQTAKVGYLSISIPNSSEAAKVQGSKIVSFVNELAKHDMSALIYLEIPASWRFSDFAGFSNGNFDSHISEMLKLVQDAGVKPESIFGYIVIPTPNLPMWDKAYIAPEQFTDYYADVYTLIKDTSEEAKVGMLLSSTTYEESPYDYTNKDYRSLVSYIKGVEDKIDILGIEGYPWLPPLSNAGEPQFRPSEFLGEAQLSELLALSTPSVVLYQTGTFNAIHLKELENKLLLPAGERNQVLNDITTEVAKLSKDKSVYVVLQMSPKGPLDADFSYFGSEYSENTLHQSILTTFLRGLHTVDVNVVFKF